MTDLFPVFLFALSSSLTPGPNNFMILNSGLTFGVKKSLPHYWGICLGFPIMALAVALGFGAVFMKYHWLKQTLKIIGIIYILYLAWQIAFATGSNSSEKSAGKPLNFFQASLFQWVNPKAWLMAISAISIFSITNNYLSNAVIISAIFLFFCLPCVGAWLLFGASLQKILKEKKHQQWFNRAMAVCLVASIALIFID
jgi:threonine/homoserine/homoserine lactone efflux protein